MIASTAMQFYHKTRRVYSGIRRGDARAKASRLPVRGFRPRFAGPDAPCGGTHPKNRF